MLLGKHASVLYKMCPIKVTIRREQATKDREDRQGTVKCTPSITGRRQLHRACRSNSATGLQKQRPGGVTGRWLCSITAAVHRCVPKCAQELPAPFCTRCAVQQTMQAMWDEREWSYTMIQSQLQPGHYGAGPGSNNPKCCAVKSVQQPTKGCAQ